MEVEDSRKGSALAVSLGRACRELLFDLKLERGGGGVQGNICLDDRGSL